MKKTIFAVMVIATLGACAKKQNEVKTDKEAVTKDTVKTTDTLKTK